MTVSKKIEVIAAWDTSGQLRPLRFRFEEDDHTLRRVSVDQVISVREVAFVGVEAFIFLCKAREEERERIFELRYNIRSHDWQLLRWVC